MTTLLKQPAETLNYTMDFTDLLSQGDYLDSIDSVTATPTGLTLGTPAIDGTNVVFSIAGGTDGVTYLLEVVVDTFDGETLEGDGNLAVADLPTGVSGLSATYQSIMADLGQWMGYGRSGWSDDAEETMLSVIRDGVAQFYWAPPLPGQPAHSWSFLKPLTTLSTVIGQEDYELPIDFGGLVGRVFYSSDEDVWVPITDVGTGQILNMRSRDLSNGTPRYAAIVPEAAPGFSPQRWTLALAPAPDAIYVLRFQYQVTPDTIGDGLSYHYGNAVHSRTLLQSCLAVAELRFRDGEQQQQQAFLTALAASIAHDRKLSPQTLGGMTEGSNLVASRHTYVTVNGVLYDNRY